jgi:hypothetical protein
MRSFTFNDSASPSLAAEVGADMSDPNKLPAEDSAEEPKGASPKEEAAPDNGDAEKIARLERENDEMRKKLETSNAERDQFAEKRRADLKRIEALEHRDAEREVESDLRRFAEGDENGDVRLVGEEYELQKALLLDLKKNPRTVTFSENGEAKTVTAYDAALKNISARPALVNVHGKTRFSENPPGDRDESPEQIAARTGENPERVRELSAKIKAAGFSL